MSEQPWLLSRDTMQPVLCPPTVSPQAFVFTRGPPYKTAVPLAQRRVQRGFVVTSVVVDPMPIRLAPKALDLESPHTCHAPGCIHAPSYSSS